MPYPRTRDLPKSPSVKYDLPARSPSVPLCVIGALFALLVTLPCLGLAQTPISGSSLASLFSKQGQVDGQFGAAEWREVDVGAAFGANDSIRVTRFARASIQFTDGGFVRLSNGSVLRFDSLRREQAPSRPVVNLDSGKAHFLNKLGGLEPEVTTPYVSAAARGTEFVVEIAGQQTLIHVLSGSVEATNQFGTALAHSGQQVVAQAGRAPITRALVDPREAVQWSFHLPSAELLRASLSELAVDGCLGALLSRSVTGGKESARWSMIAQTAACPPSAERELVSAIAQLDVGEIATAKQKFKSLSSSAGTKAFSAIADAYLALIAILENNQAEAYRAIGSAREAAPTSLLSRYISSVVYQSAGELERARAECLPPEKSELMRLRCAELMLMNNEAKGASEILASHDPTPGFEAEHSVLAGFIALQERDFGSAQPRFTNAVRIDPSMARAHFGLGLVTIAQGELEDALPYFLAAVSLEPQSAVYRSYLGKLYFELGAEPRALEELAGALLIDAQDPTPLLYRSFVELSQNQPIAALRSLEESIERNRNRAVYRSSALLDQDRAVRSASIGRIFSELGLQGPARTEALRSISADYLNYSAHQLLADANDSLNELDASISERRIASLLAPLSLNALANTGGRSSFGEYSAMFDRAETRSSWGLTWDGRDDIAAWEALVASLEGPLGVSLRYQGAMRDGSTDVNYGRSHRIFGSADYELRPSSRIRLSLDGAFDDSSDSAQSIEDSEFRSGAAELSYTESLSNSSYWLSSVRYVREDADLLALTESPGILAGLFAEDPTDLETLFLLNQDTDETLDRVQASSQFISTLGLSPLGQGQLVFGFQLNSIDANRDEESEILDDSSGLFTFAPWRLASEATNELQSADGYAYANFRPLHWLTATVGATATSLEFERRPIAPYIERTSRESHVSPKVGLLLTPLESVLIRASYFETLAKSTLEDQSSLEPTVVGGFSQRFNDFAGTQARALAVGLDYKDPGSTYLGIEWIGRKLKEESSLAFPVLEFNFDEPSVTDVIGVQDNDTFSTQDLVRAYAAQLLGSSWVIGSEWQWSELRYTDPLAFESQQTNRVSGTVRYFDPSGLFALSRVSWRSQDLLGNALFPDGDEEFTLVDLALGYRLPRRQGKLSLEFLNIGDTQFDYDQAFGFEPFISPRFSIVGRIELTF